MKIAITESSSSSMDETMRLGRGKALVILAGWLGATWAAGGGRGVAGWAPFFLMTWPVATFSTGISTEDSGALDLRFGRHNLAEPSRTGGGIGMTWVNFFASSSSV